jgi:hypothetical protein
MTTFQGLITFASVVLALMSCIAVFEMAQKQTQSNERSALAERENKFLRRWRKRYSVSWARYKESSEASLKFANEEIRELNRILGRLDPDGTKRAKDLIEESLRVNRECQGKSNRLEVFTSQVKVTGDCVPVRIAESTNIAPSRRG